MRLIGLVVVIGFALLANPLGAGSQPPGQKVPRIGYLDGASLSANSVRLEAFRHGLRELGYVEGQSVAIEWRSADGKADRLPGLAAELVRLKVDVIVTGGAGATRPAKEATATIPIVMAQDSDPVESGFVTSLARPGGNVTGLSMLHPELSVKRLELLKEMQPKLSRVAVFGTSSWAGNAHGLRETKRAAQTLRLKLQYVAYRVRRISRLRSRPPVRGKRKPSSCWCGTPFSMPAERKL
jgi:putative tryptophan/tyrosine transport system substrate-binding protein